MQAKPYMVLGEVQASTPRGSASQRAGLYYEQKVRDYFALRYLCAYQVCLRWPGRWHKAKYPDLLLFNEEMTRCVVVEVKHQFTELALPQVKQYEDVLRVAYPWLTFSSLVVCGQLVQNPGVHHAAFTPAVFSLPSPSVMVLSKRELKAGKYDGLDGSGGAAQASFWESGSVRYPGGEFRGVSSVVAKAGT